MNERNMNEPEPDPAPNDQLKVWSMVIADMEARDRAGIEKYGVPLQAFNGREPLVDAYQEALDLVVYMRQAIIELSEIRDEIERIIVKCSGSEEVLDDLRALHAQLPVLHKEPHR